jgi:hypothetical protein
MYQQQAPIFPVGSFLQIQGPSKPHEAIAGPICSHGQQIIIHTEPEVGHHAEHADSFFQRYRLIAYRPPANDAHAGETVRRALARLGDSYDGVFDNCQHGARGAYFGRPESPIINGLFGLLALGVGVYALRR